MIKFPCSLGEDASIRLVMIMQGKADEGNTKAVYITHDGERYFVDGVFKFSDLCRLLILASEGYAMEIDDIRSRSIHIEYTMVNVTDDERTRIMRLFSEFTTADSKDSPFNTFMCTLDEQTNS